MKYCRDSCMNISADNISDVEKKCYKNCSRKYLEQFSIFNTYKDEYAFKYGTNKFVVEKPQKEAFNKLVDLMKLNSKE